MKSITTWDERIARLVDSLGRVSLAGDLTRLPTGPLITVTCSRLGHDLRLHSHVCRFLTRSLFDCRQRGGVVLIAAGSAIESWAVRACELFNVPMVQLTVDGSDVNADLHVTRSDCRGQVALSRDAVVIALADRVDAVFVRNGGAIEESLRRRIEDRRDASTRVALSLRPDCAAADLIDAGAIGWFQARQRRCNDQRVHVQPSGWEPSAEDAWTRTDGEWLVHCTRGREGAWPGETLRQYQDLILLGNDRERLSKSEIKRRPVDALARILRSGRIVASATASVRKHPVVCFSAIPLEELLRRRCFRPHLKRWDYEPYGIAIRVAAAKELGIQPVIYGDPADRRLLSSDDQYRFQPVGRTYDWRSEREWRSRQSVDLNAIDPHDVRVFAADTEESREVLRNCPWDITAVNVPSDKKR